MITQSVSAAVRAVTNDMHQVKQTVRTVQESPPLTDDRFVAVMSSFIAQSDLQVKALENMSKAADDEVKKTLQYFGESTGGSETVRPEDFFGLVMSFSTDLQVSLNSNFYSLKSDTSKRKRQWT